MTDEKKKELINEFMLNRNERNQCNVMTRTMTNRLDGWLVIGIGDKGPCYGAFGNPLACAFALAYLEQADYLVSAIRERCPELDDETMDMVRKDMQDMFDQIKNVS